MYSSHHHKHHARRLLCLTALLCFAAGGTAYACTRKAAVPQLPELPAESLEQPAEYGVQQSTLTAAQAQAILDDPRMILVSRTHPITKDYPVETKECGSATAINKTLQTEMDQAAEDMQNLLYTIPNVPYDEVPEGVGAEDNVVEKMGGMETELPKDALPHWELAKKYD